MLATRAYRALNQVCLGKARRVRFKSRGRGLSTLENKRTFLPYSIMVLSSKADLSLPAPETFLDTL